MARRRRRFGEDRQTEYNVPSQAPSREVSYVNNVASDIVQQAPLKKRRSDGYTRPAPYVISMYDARPINGYDFVETFSTAEQAGADARVFDYLVPAGRVAVFRRLDVRIYMATVARDALTAQPLVGISASFTVDGIPIDGVNSIRVDDAICGVIAGATSDVLWQNGLSIPLYFLGYSGQTIRLTFTNLNAGGFDFGFVAPVLTGNLLQSFGLETAEPGTKEAIPVADARYPVPLAATRHRK